MTWSVSFDFKPVGDPISGWGNIFHNSIGADSGIPGSRIPGIYTTPGAHQLYISSYVNGIVDYAVTVNTVLTMEWHTILVEQQFVNLKYMYTIVVDGELIHSVENTTPEMFYDVKTWVSNEWYDSSPGLLKNLKIITEKCKMQISLLFNLKVITRFMQVRISSERK